MREQIIAEPIPPSLTTPELPTFDIFWAGMGLWLKKKKLIRHWSICNSYFDREFEAQYDPQRDLVKVVDIKLRKRTFQIMYENWNRYVQREISRRELCGKDFFTGYTISILKEYFDYLAANQGLPTPAYTEGRGKKAASTMKRPTVSNGADDKQQA